MNLNFVCILSLRILFGLILKIKRLECLQTVTAAKLSNALASAILQLIKGY